MTTSANTRPAAWRMRSRRSWGAGLSPTIACRAASSASAGARSMSTSTFRRISLAAASRTSTATSSAATASTRGWPARTSSRPTSTASEPPRSLPKWSAFEASAGLEYARAARHEAVVLARSMQITMPTTRSAYQVARTEAPPSTSRTIARQTMTTLATTRIAPSARAARCSAFPCPYWCPGSAGRTATPTAKNVSSAAMRSVPEWAASEMRPRLWVARPVPSLSAMSASAASTDQSAAFRWASTPGSVRSGLDADRLRRPDEGVLPEREVAAARRSAQRERDDRRQLDLGLRRDEEPAIVVHLGSCVRRENAVALGEEGLEGAGLGAKGLSPRPVPRGEDPARLAYAHAFHFLPFAGRLERHPCVERGHAVDATHAERGQPTRRVDAE